MRKIDKNLKTFFEMSNEQSEIVCLAYVNNFNFAKNFFASLDIQILSELRFIDAMVLKLSSDNLKNIAMQNFVDFISSTAKVSALMNVAREIVGTKYIDSQGENVTIAVIDTGISSHLDFVMPQNRIIAFENFIDDRKTNFDDNGHGTFVAGVCAGNGLVSGGKFAGIAPKAKIVSLKALNNKGEATAMQILNALQWVYDNHKKYNIKVVCMSFGSQPLGINDPIMRGAERLWQKGICMVAAAGNSGPKFETIKSPGISPRIITVGGFDDNRIDDTYNENFFEIAEFSSRGPALGRMKPDVVAPAVDITSCGVKDNYVSLSGTSVATPIIAGLCAKIISLNPKLSPDQVKRIIQRNSKPITFNRNKEGYGYTTFNKTIKIV